MSDPSTDAGVGKSIGQLFSPPVLTALRYLLTAISPLLAIVGVVALSPQQIDHIISVAQQLGIVVGAIAALLGILAPIAATIFGTFKSTQGQQIKSAVTIATGPKSEMASSAQQAIITGTNAISQDPTIPGSSAAVVALINGVRKIAEQTDQSSLGLESVGGGRPTSQISKAAKAALIDAVAAQPEVIGKINVTDATLVAATTSEQVQKAV
jgi:hypothetical protein